MNYLRRKLKTKVGMMSAIMILTTFVIGLSYGTFVITTGRYDATEMLISNLTYGIEIKGTSTNPPTINNKTVTTNNTTTVLVTITSLNNIDSMYNLGYKILEGEGNVYYASSTGWYPSGKISKDGGEIYKKTIKVVIETNSNVSVEFNVSGGYINNNKPTLIGYTEITNEYNGIISYINGNPLKDIVENESECESNICYYGGESKNNYLQYPKDLTSNTNNIWRIIGSNTEGIKIVSNITSTIEQSNINTSLTSFYNTLEKTKDYIQETNKFNCSSSGCDTSTYNNIGLMSTYEYNRIGGNLSYLANTNNFFSINNTSIENITPSGIEETTTSTTSGLRPVVYLQDDVSVTGSGTESDPYRLVSKGDIIIASASLDGTPLDTFPKESDPYIVKEVSCTNGTTGVWDEERNTIRLTNINLPTTCNVDFTGGPTITLTSTTVNITAPVNPKVGRDGKHEFTVSAKTGYTLTGAEVSCPDGANGSISGNKVTITNIKQDQTCTVTGVSLPKVTLTVNNGSGGGVKYPSASGGTVTYTITANSGYTLDNPTISGSCTISGNKVTASNVTSDRNCTITLQKEKPTLYSVLSDGVKYTVGNRRTFDRPFGASSANTNATISQGYNQTGTIYKTGNDYYFAGNPSDNWVKFAGKYWRIIRSNSTEGTRLLYAGDTANSKLGCINNGSSCTTYVWNSSYNNASYVQWSNYASAIRSALDSWYNSNITGSNANMVNTNVTYCNDTSQASTSGSNIYYGAYGRLIDAKTPNYTCGSNSNSTHKSVGLMTADEVAFAGGEYGYNSPNTYYYRNSVTSGCTGTSGDPCSVTGDNHWWTMSPSHFNGTRASVFRVLGAGSYPGSLNNPRVDNSNAVRPVVTLKSSVLVSGSGTASDPFVPSL